VFFVLETKDLMHIYHEIIETWVSQRWRSLLNAWKFR